MNSMKLVEGKIHDACIVEEKGRICIFCILAPIHLFFFLELRHLNTKVKFGMKTFVHYMYVRYYCVITIYITETRK